jgi:DNA-binding NarL/FixJ family response regulator
MEDRGDESCRGGGRAIKRLVIVADNSLIVEAIQIGLRQSGAFNLLGHVNARRTSARKIVHAAPDVVLVDDMDHSELALNLIRGITEESEDVTVLVLTVRMDEEWLNEIFEAGASGAISKAIRPDALPLLVRETLEGNVVHVGSRGSATSNTGRVRAFADEDCPLTTRELEILQLVASGSTNGEIARRLWVTEQTVKFHLSNIYRKLEIENRTQASHYAHVNGMVIDDRVELTVAS